ncbi:hypothetical protein ACM614_16450 [Streptomyces sp. 12297]
MNRVRIRPALLATAIILTLVPAGLGATAAQASPATATVAAAAVSSDTETIITGTTGLNRGEAWYSPDRRTMLIQQYDGHVVLYRDNVAIWTATGSYGYGNTFYMQADGNLVSYDAAMRPLWNSGTNYHPGAYLAVQNGGNLVVYQGSTPLWWSNFRPGGPVDPGDDCTPKPGRLCP